MRCSVAESAPQSALHALLRGRLVAAFVLLLGACLLGLPLPACAQGEAARLHDAGLVEPSRLDPSIRLDIRYATSNNFVGRPVYPSARCYLRQDVAKGLLAVQAGLRASGLGLKLYDCYRPFSVQEAFWAIMPDERYVLEPKREGGRMVKSSRHNRGAAVDLTLVDLKTGAELPMPTGYDDFSEKAHRDAACQRPEACRNSKTLERAMVAQGFVPLSTEWWHFDASGWESCEPLDLPLPSAP